MQRSRLRSKVTKVDAEPVPCCNVNPCPLPGLLYEPSFKMPDTPLPDTLAARIDAVLGEIRVPDLPYSVGPGAADHSPDWRPLLQENWRAQSDQRVADVLKAQEGPWTVRQVNAAYLADRIMDVFLRSSGLHPVLVTRLARLRYPLAWRLADEPEKSFVALLITWLDGFEHWRGWSNSGGRSSRALLDQLDRLVVTVDEDFEAGRTQGFIGFCQQWQVDVAKRQQHSTRLHQRLLETEQGAARQRKAEQTARATVGRALQGRALPSGILRFVLDHWLSLLRQVAWNEGTASDNWRHATRLLEWIVWTGDPDLSGKNVDRLYQVGEQLTDRISEVWQRVRSEPVPAGPLSVVEAVLLERLRGGSPATVPAEGSDNDLEFDAGWLDQAEVPAEAAVDYQGRWFVKGSGDTEQRRCFLALLEDSAEILWSNGYGVRLAVSPWRDFLRQLDSGDVRPLPELTRFGDVLADTVTALDGVRISQRQQRQQAAKTARDRAERLQLERETAERERREANAVREAEARKKTEQAEAQAREQETERLEAIRLQRLEKARSQVDGLKLGNWIAIREGDAERRLKLAVRTNASQKLIFVDRLGLNRTEITVSALIERLLEESARILGSTAEFDETLSRVIGRIRVGR